MQRQPLQILVIPFRVRNNKVEFGLFKRTDTNYWQFIAGGAEGTETALEAAKREAFEEAGISLNSNFIPLDSICSIPANIFEDWRKWPKGTLVIKEFSFGVEFKSDNFRLSHEHTECKWCLYEDAWEHLHWDSNKTALWELSQRIVEDESTR